MTYIPKYIPKIIGKPMGSPGKGKKVNPDNWKTGTNPIRRDKYYAYLKHKSQAAFRGEEYYLTWEEWEGLWTDELWHKRGRKISNLCLTRPGLSGPWCISNVEIATRRKHFDYKKQQNDRS